ncbi:MAG: hypothetical protein QOK34_1607 [Gaiellaceae bacterium]|nr:hypothetical protein [Gaiellaceae bacterium]
MEGGVTPGDATAAHPGQWRERLFDADACSRGRTWFRSGDRAFPRLSNAQTPDEQFFAAVSHLLSGHTHPRILVPARMQGPGALRSPRQIDVRDWISGSGHPDPSVEVPFSAVERLVRRERDHGPAETSPEYWVGVAVEVLDGLAPTEFYRREVGDNRNLRRQLRGIQKRLGTAGVLPWGAFKAGVVPAAWESSPAISAALEQWYREAAAIDAMERVIDGLVAGLAMFEGTADAELAEAALLIHLRAAA